MFHKLLFLAAFSLEISVKQDSRFVSRNQPLTITIMAVNITILTLKIKAFNINLYSNWLRRGEPEGKKFRC